MIDSPSFTSTQLELIYIIGLVWYISSEFEYHLGIHASKFLDFAKMNARKNFLRSMFNYVNRTEHNFECGRGDSFRIVLSPLNKSMPFPTCMERV